MSCDVAIAAFLMFASTQSATQSAPAPTLIPAVAAAPQSVAQEPLFRDIVDRATGLKGQVESWRASIGMAADPIPLIGFDAFSAKVGELSALDQKGHETLKARGAADDLKCILHGISQDLPLKLQAVKEAKTGHDEDLALRDMSYLLRDNIEVITAPPQPAA